MSANINITNGQESVMVVGESAWHRMGVRLDSPATAEQAIQLGGLDYMVEKRTLTAEGVEKPLRSVATVRQDTNVVLGIVGSRYTIIQNRDAFSFFDEMVDKSEAIYHSAGVLGDGERIWVQAKMPEYIKVGKDDLTEMFVTLTNSHDGYGALKAYLTPIRVVCENTLRASLGNCQNKVSIRHTANAEDRLKEAHKIMGLSNLYAKEMQEAFNHMASTSIGKGGSIIRGVDDFLAWAFPSDAPTKDEVHTRTKNNRLELLETIETGVGQQEAKRGTQWWLFNGYTRFLENKGVANTHWEVEELLDGSIHANRQKAFEYITR